MRKNIIGFALGATLLALSFPSAAQQAKKIPRIGFLGGGSPSTHKVVLDAFRQGVRELGYIEGQNIAIEYRYADGKSERLADLAAELVRLRLDVIVTSGTQVTRAVKQASSTIPIVVAGAGDLVGAGLVASLAHPGGNVTGSTNIDPDLIAKPLKLLKESFPKLSRVAVLYRGGSRGDAEELKEIQAAARTLKIQV